MKEVIIMDDDYQHISASNEAEDWVMQICRMHVVMRISSEILDIFYHQDEFTTSDLQGAIEAQVTNAYLEGKNA
jgi:hypothetical protein